MKEINVTIYSIKEVLSLLKTIANTECVFIECDMGIPSIYSEDDIFETMFDYDLTKAVNHLTGSTFVGCFCADGDQDIDGIWFY